MKLNRTAGLPICTLLEIQSEEITCTHQVRRNTASAAPVHHLHWPTVWSFIQNH